jgi:iron complex outermembrane recepter protein
MRLMTTLLGSTLLMSAPAFAQEASRHGDHADMGRDIVVTGLITRDRTDILSGTSVLRAEALQRDVRPTIGETLIHQAGVSATSFGPNASRPVLRGFQGERVRVLSDGIGSFDVSNTSVDHAVVINPLTADRIEVLRGPSALLYGSSAIGGVVNVIDSRIPRSLPAEAIHMDASVTYGSAAQERSGGARLDVPVGSHLVLHFDGTYSKSGDLRTGGDILTPALRAAALASGDADIAALADLKGDLPNSAGRTWEVAGGAALIADGGTMGFSVSRYDNLYGVPVRYSVDPLVEAEKVRLDMSQTRIDWRGEITPAGGALEAIRVRAGYADYQHNEIDDTGAVGTTFLNKGWEGRLELVQRASDSWRGAVGGQFFLRDLNIIGDEKFLPKSEAQQYGLFTLQSYDLGTIRTELGARLEQSIVSATADSTLGNAAIRRSFTALSGSLGASVAVTDGWRMGLNASYTERAPSMEELFANGPHAGTQAFEVGNPNFAKEQSKGLELTVHGKGSRLSINASLYYSWFQNFIYETPTGTNDLASGLPIFVNRQADARHYGAEVEASLRLAQVDNFAVNLDAVGDFSHAAIKHGGAVPRIPALRLLGGLEAQSDTLTGRIETEWVDGQDRVASFETPTKGYTMVNASVNWKPFAGNQGTMVTLSANNIFDVIARRHASVLKDYAPLAGRDIRVSLRFNL